MFIDGNAISELPLQADEKGRLAFHPSLVEREGKELEIKVIFWNAQYPKMMHSEVPAFTWLKGKEVVRLRAYNLYEMTPRAIPNENNEPATYKRPYHVIRRGDTWESIEQEAGVNRYALLWENGLDEATPLETLEGKKIYFPRGVRKGNAKTKTPTSKPTEKKKERNVLQVRSENNGKPVDVAQGENNCLCHRTFTVDEFKLIIQRLYKAKSIPNLWIPAQSTGAEPSDKSYESSVKELNRILEKYEINSCLRKLHFLAQIFHETHGFRSAQEYGKVLSYDPYRGRGLIHLTHDYNYKAFSKYINDKKVVTNPNLVATNLEYVFESGGWYWRKGSAWGDLNKWADKDDLYYLNIGVNGGFVGFKERIDYVNILINLLNVKECSQLSKNNNLGIYTYSESDIKNTKYGKRNEQKFKKFDMR
ncbi:hypothetical protein [Actinobacillus equuli]|uniref:hypothetical protein n=1 Tax=Actinobacillus equuli TaxID=718 RepID=UPI002442BCCB|nr:hypothetical protein [Actinobacillus equuli]WGE76011.1 hypothetical protein NYR81_03420 [Actinobacillus equuli subsp. haemolyticus]WGE78116.1 hypothetical protein NYR82_04595 [Actinobacillus equuli subsp. haemolyticus]